MTLPNDICRCHDSLCEQREKCLRWLCRETGRVHVGTLKQVGEELCWRELTEPNSYTPVFIQEKP